MSLTRLSLRFSSPLTFFAFFSPFEVKLNHYIYSSISLFYKIVYSFFFFSFAYLVWNLVHLDLVELMDLNFRGNSNSLTFFFKNDNTTGSFLAEYD